MQNIYENSTEFDKIVKKQYGLPDFIMMENAAHAMADFITNLKQQNQALTSTKPVIYILCGKGNNGADGMALGRLLQGTFHVALICPDTPTAQEAKTQYSICQKLGIKIFTDIPKGKPDFVVDCLFGTGFHGDLKLRDESLLSRLSTMEAVKIACDIPSALFFKADYTITMGNLKMALFSDKGKAVCGKIITVNLGVAQSKYQDFAISENSDDDTIPLIPLPTAYLIEKSDMKLPMRTNRSAHKGTYGHTAVFAGSKAGAGIMSATAAMTFGSGLTTIVKTDFSNLDQFKISPELMVSSQIPERATCLVLGPGLADAEGSLSYDVLDQFTSWFMNTDYPACVLDADIFDFVELSSLLEELNSKPEARIVLTPHLKEYEKLIDKVPNLSSLKNVTVVRKSSNTFITNNGDIFICSDGAQSLAKGGSGDILSGMIGALLAQGYSSKDAAITAVEAHALASQEGGECDYSLTPLKLLTNLENSLSETGLEK